MCSVKQQVMGLFNRSQMVLVLLFLVAATPVKGNAGVSSGEELVEQFLSALQKEVVLEIDHWADNAESVLDCIDQGNCEVSQEILNKYRQYRVYVALMYYEDLKNRITQMGKGNLAHGGGTLWYSIRNQAGREEWALIEEMHRLDEFEITRHLAKTGVAEGEKDHYELKKSLINGRFGYYGTTISEFLSNYPFFALTSEQVLTEEKLSDVLIRSGTEYEEAAESAASLKGNERLELLGFTDAVYNTVEKFSEENNRVISAYLQSLNNNTKLWGRIVGVLTNWKTLAIGICHVTVYAMSGVPHPYVYLHLLRAMAAVGCKALGIGITLNYVAYGTKDMLRQLQYASTGIYDREILGQYIRTYLTTLVMSTLYVVPALPGLVGSLKEVKKLGDISKRVYRMNRLSFSRRPIQRGYNIQQFTNDLKSMGRRYAEYYGEEFALHTALSAGGNYLSTVSNLERAIVRSLTRAMNRSIPVFSYGDLLKAI